MALYTWDSCPLLGNLSRAPVIGSCRSWNLSAQSHTVDVEVMNLWSVTVTTLMAEAASCMRCTQTHCPCRQWACVGLILCNIQLWGKQWHRGPRCGLPRYVLSCGIDRLITIYLFNTLSLSLDTEHPDPSCLRFLQQVTTNLYRTSVEDTHLRLGCSLVGGKTLKHHQQRNDSMCRTGTVGPYLCHHAYILWW